MVGAGLTLSVACSFEIQLSSFAPVFQWSCFTYEESPGDFLVSCIDALIDGLEYLRRTKCFELLQKLRARD